ncbi:Prolyl 4-hydroxylase subunit alpha-2-like 1 [Homarus americanus]|uniref:Prolyl 4-hydroxylase subunit alpha-2-like 1 n=1 Tax=Homarus americanus TaxID=6706 RepID=A0A8J5JSU4_HOMAM|nr:Prolyl 4-hydroxylase subunit alpha-2-like 1 [Homarus americanus]
MVSLVEGGGGRGGGGGGGGRGGGRRGRERGGGGGWIVIMVMAGVMGRTWGLGDVHTSVATVAQLVEAEHHVISTLQEYLDKEEERLNTIRKYIGSWQGGQADYVHNPINSYHFLRRLTQEYTTVQDALYDTSLQAVRENITWLRESVDQPVEADVNGAAYALVRLQHIYDLNMNDLVEGDILGTKAIQELKGLEMMKARQPLTHHDQLRIDKLTKQQHQRVLMRDLVTKLAKSSDEKVLQKFSGLGIPTSFQKQIYADDKEFGQLDKLDNYYQRLCRGDQVQVPEAYRGLKCGYVHGNSGYRRLMPFKVELRWPDPVIVVYHDVLSDAETDMVREIATPRLTTTMVHSFTTHEARKSLARIGKAAWVRRGDDKTVDKILQRIEDMTSLTTRTSEDFHLNDVEAGGSTVFPMLGVEVPARRGSALFWFNIKRSGQGDYRTLHAACPIKLKIIRWDASKRDDIKKKLPSIEEMAAQGLPYSVDITITTKTSCTQWHEASGTLCWVTRPAQVAWVMPVPTTGRVRYLE